MAKPGNLTFSAFTEALTEQRPDIQSRNFQFNG